MKDHNTNKNRKKKVCNTRERIMENARELFFSYGLKSISMDELAKQSGISKKTIYRCFEDKDVLVHAVVVDLIQLHERLHLAYQTIANDAIDEAIELGNDLFGIWADIRPGFYYETKKFFPNAWLELEEYSLKMRTIIINNLEKGKKEGLYRNNIKPGLVADVRLHQLIDFLQSRSLTSEKLTTDQLIKELTILYLQSIVTEKGRNILDYYLKNERL